MTTYNTQNPLGSADPRDLYDNAENADRLINGQEAGYADRLGNDRLSWAGMEQAFQDFLLKSGYQDIGPYAAGLEITARNQIFLRNGEYHRAGPSLDLPYTTTGDWATEGESFVSVGDAALRQALADPAQGGELVQVDTSTGEQTLKGALNARAIYVDSIADLLAFDTARLLDGQHVSVRGYYAGSSLGRGDFVWSEDSEAIADDGLFFQVNGVPTGRWHRLAKSVSVFDFGAVGDGIADDTTSIQSAIDCDLPVYDSNFINSFKTTETITVTRDKNINIAGLIVPSIENKNAVYVSDIETENNSIVRLRVSGSSMTATGVGTSDRVVTNGIVFERCSGLRFRGGQVKNVPYGAVVFFDCSECTAIDNKVNNTGTVEDTFASSNNPGVTIGSGISFQNCTNCTARRNKLNDIWQIGIFARAEGEGNVCSDILISGNFIRDVHDNAIRLQYDNGATCDRATVSGNNIARADIDGIRCNGRHHAIFGNNIKDVSNRGIAMERGRHVSITSNIIDGCISGVSLRNDGGCSRISISNNIISGYTGDGGIFIFTGEGTPTDDDMRSISITGNDIDGGGVAIGGIGVSNARQVVINGNNIRGVKRRGISVGMGRHATISGNTLHDLSSEGIYAGIEVFSTFDASTIVGNTISNPDPRTATGIKLGSNALKFNVSGNTIENFSLPIDTPSHDGVSRICANNSE